MKIEEISQKASQLLEAGLQEGDIDPFLQKIALDAKDTALSLMGEERAKKAIIKAFLELILAAHILEIDLDSELAAIFSKRIAERIAEAG